VNKNNSLITELQQVNLPAAAQLIIVWLSKWLGILAVAGMFISILIEVVGRSFFGHATIWVTEVSTYLVVAITFLSAALVASRDGNVRVDLILNKLPPERQKILKFGLGDIATAITLIVLWQAVNFWSETFVSGLRSWSLMVTPMWIPQLAMVVGFVNLALVLILKQAPSDRPYAIAPALAGWVLAIADGVELLDFGLPTAVMVLVLFILPMCGAALSRRFSSLIATVGVLLPLGCVFLLTQDMPLSARSAAMICALFLLLFTGLPVVFSLLLLGVSAMAFWLPTVAIHAIGERSWGAINTFELAAIPMFVLMGAVLARSDASGDMYRAVRHSIGKVRGSLAHASILASGLFAAISGSSLATAATMGRVAGPEMMKAGYKPELTYGALAAGGTLGILIPPSIAMIIYGPLAGVPVTELFLAGIIPGLLMITAFSVVIWIWTIVAPNATPIEEQTPRSEKLASIVGVLPIVLLITLVLGSIYAGVATPTEAGAVGVLGAVLISLARRTMSIADLITSVEEAATTTSFLLMIAVGAAVMSFALDYLAMPQALVAVVETLNLPNFGLFLAIVALYLVLGMFVEPISMILITLPIILPVIATAGWDPLWFGIILVMLVEIGLITPPVGMLLYVLAGVSGDQVSLMQISKGTIPFVGAFLVMILVFYFVPGLVTFLPDLMR